jgi:hypothetical protein
MQCWQSAGSLLHTYGTHRNMLSITSSVLSRSTLLVRDEREYGLISCIHSQRRVSGRCEHGHVAQLTHSERIPLSLLPITRVGEAGSHPCRGPQFADLAPSARPRARAPPEPAREDEEWPGTSGGRLPGALAGCRTASRGAEASAEKGTGSVAAVAARCRSAPSLQCLHERREPREVLGVGLPRRAGRARRGRARRCVARSRGAA